MPVFEWEHKPDEHEDGQTFAHIHREAFRIQIAMIVNAHQQNNTTELAELRSVVFPRIWELATSVILGLLNVEDILDEELDGRLGEDE